MNKIKVVQIGSGHDHSVGSIEMIKKLSNIFELVGYVFIDDGYQAYEKIKHPAFDGVKRLTLEQAFAIPDLKLAVIETDDSNLTKYTKLALEHGLHVQMDKPGGQNEKEFNEMVDFAKEKGLIFHTGYMYRYNPAINKAIEIIKSGEIGEVYSIETQMSCCLDEKKRAWLKNFNGGMINFLGCHLLDVILRIKGQPKEVYPLSVASRKDLGGEDVGFAVLKYDNCVASIKCNCMEVGGPIRRRIVITGEKGCIEIFPTEYAKDGYGQLIFSDIRVAIGNDKPWYYNPNPCTFGPYDRYEEMFMEVYKIINDEMKNPYSYEYEKTLHKVLLKTCGL